MGQYRRIPVVRNQGLVMPTQATQKSSSVLGWLIWVVAVFALMLIFVWLKVETNLTLAHIRIL